jgi:HK97 gp10 family phage protein
MPGPTGLLIGGVSLDTAVRVDQTIVNLRKIDATARTATVAAVRRAGDSLLEIVHATVAYDTGFMHDHVRVVYSPKGYAFEGGWNQDDFDAAGLPFYPPFVEFGTSRMQARPSLLPAYEDVTRHLEADVARLVAASVARAAAARASGGGAQG